MSRPSSRGVVPSSREARPSGAERYRAYTVLLEYPIRALIAIPAVSSDSPQSLRRRRSEELRIGCIGAGSFARAGAGSRRKDQAYEARREKGHTQKSASP